MTRVDKFTGMTLEEKQGLLDELAEAIYKDHRELRPMFPWVFVLVLRREQKVGSIVLPEHEQHKVTHEGVVLATWSPYTHESTKRTKDGAEYTQLVMRKSALKTGDHVIFPHWAGLPLSGFDSSRFRVIKEEAWAPDKEGGAFAVVDYSPIEENAKAQLMLMIEHMLSEPEKRLDSMSRLLTEAIVDRFVMIDREEGSVTVSGK